MNLMSTLRGSLLENFFPQGWDLKKLDSLCARAPEAITKPERWWNKRFTPIPCNTLEDFDTMLGHEIALEILNAKMNKKQIAFILPVGPMGMYRWAVYFLKEWNCDCRHVHGFNMDEWSDPNGKTLPSSDSGAFQYAMEQAFYGPLGKLTVPKAQRHFATKDRLPKYPAQIRELKKKGARLVTVFGIGRVCHIAFWEPHFAAEYKSVADWKNAEYRLGAKLHPLTIEQNAITSFKSRTTLVPTTANTIGPGLFLKSDRIIGGADGSLGRGMMWQGMSLWATLHHEPTPWIPSTFMPTLPGRLFFLKEIAGPLVAECN
ncbi:MAG: glucosamine-6-phosphate isomerase [Candidatus Hydrogenedentes bacterium]|nr:glucosamine-6-phosphate isomerase [Candidatus Hydrogenedentota bacterium]